MAKKWRPPDWPKNPCDGCPHKEEDEYGLLCSGMSCGEDAAYTNYEAGADAMLKVLRVSGKYWVYKENIMEDESGLHPLAFPIIDIKDKAGTLAFIPDEEE